MDDDIELLAPATDAFAITPHDTNTFPKTRGVFAATITALTVEMASGSVVTFTGLAQGVIHPLQIVKVLSSGTTATGIVGVR